MGSRQDLIADVERRIAETDRRLADVEDRLFDLRKRGVSDKTLERHRKLMLEMLESLREYRRLLMHAADRNGD